MSIIVPAILPTSREDLVHKLERLVGSTTDVQDVQIDMVDGRFISPPTWPYTTAKADLTALFPENSLPYVGQLHYEMDLMVEDPGMAASPWIDAGATRIVVHAESTRFLGQFVSDMKRTYGHDKDFAPGLLSFGLAINLGSEISLIEPYLSDVDFVQFMGIRRIGKQGEAFDPAVLKKIATFRKKYPDMPIQVDGGVSLQSAPALLSAGVSRLVVGSALWGAPDFAEALAKFEALTIEHGRYEK